MRLLICLLLFSGISFGQNWAPNGAQWHYSYIGFFPGYVDIAYTADTIIDGQLAKKLTKTYHGLGWGMGINSSEFGAEYTYEANGVVYLRYQNHWDTLYNFNAQVGESWPMAKQPLISNIIPPNSRMKVLSTGTMTINNEPRNYLVIDRCDSINYSFGFLQDTLIENIGFMRDYMLPYDQFDGAVDANEGGPLRCYSHYNFVTYQPIFTEVCDYIMGTNEINATASFQIYPNPVSDQVNIPATYTAEFKTYRIISTEGKLVQSGQTSEQIDVANLPAGSYTLLVENTSQIRCAKVLVLR
mgnify:FL=1|jgi:hypothetical protein